MKAFFSSLLFVLVLACGKSSFEFSQYRHIQTQTYKEECSLTTAKIIPKLNRVYYWYKANTLHHSRGDFGGELLHGTYKRFFITNELEIKGEFINGLKEGIWKTWHKNGQLRKIERWKNGLLIGKYKEFNNKGELVLAGKYSKGVKKGKWIDFVKKDTSIYRKGQVKLPKVKSKNNESLVKGFFRKKSKSEKSIRVKDSLTSVNKSAKTSFLKRIFRKKKANSNVKS